MIDITELANTHDPKRAVGYRVWKKAPLIYSLFWGTPTFLQVYSASSIDDLCKSQGDIGKGANHWQESMGQAIVLLAEQIYKGTEEDGFTTIEDVTGTLGMYHELPQEFKKHAKKSGLHYGQKVIAIMDYYFRGFPAMGATHTEDEDCLPVTLVDLVTLPELKSAPPKKEIWSQHILTSDQIWNQFEYGSL